MHIFILSLLPSRASTGESMAAFSMQFSVNMRQDMVPAEPDWWAWYNMCTNTSRVRLIFFHGNKWGNHLRPDGPEGVLCCKSLLNACYARKCLC